MMNYEWAASAAIPHTDLHRFLQMAASAAAVIVSEAIHLLFMISGLLRLRSQ
jgi:hypothetical protein